MIPYEQLGKFSYDTCYICKKFIDSHDEVVISSDIIVHAQCYNDKGFDRFHRYEFLQKLVESGHLNIDKFVGKLKIRD